MGLFATSKKLAAPASAKKKGDKKQIELAGLADFAKLDALIKTATAMKATMEADLKAAGFEQFMDMVGGTRPSSFEGIDGSATASVELRKRSSASALSAEEVEALESVDIIPETQVVTPGLFAINPKFAEDQALLQKVEKALMKIVPDDFIVRQEEVSKRIVTDAILDEAWRRGEKEALAIMTTMALKPKLSAEYDMSKLMDDAKAIMFPKKTTKKAS